MNILGFLERTYARLSSIQRCNTIPRFYNESVASHSYFVALIAMMICDEMNLNTNTKFIVVKKALLHDIEECFSGDITAILKFTEPEFAVKLKEINEKSLQVVLKGMPEELKKDYTDVWKSAEFHDILKTADYLASSLYALQEIKMGNKNVVHLLVNSVRLLNRFEYTFSKNIVAELIKESELLGLSIDINADPFEEEKNFDI